MASVTITGSGGVTIGTTTTPVAAQTGAPPELHGSQWGLLRFDVRPRKEESN